MDLNLKNEFLEKWKKYFGDAEIPFTWFYILDTEGYTLPEPSPEWGCLVCELSQVRKGKTLVYNGELIRCGGGKRYLGFTDRLRPNFEYFLSCGIPGEMEGERYIRTPEMVKEMQKNIRKLPVDGKYIVFKRWDKLEANDEPEAVIFFARPDVLSGLFTLANFDQPEGRSVIAPFGAGCGSIVYHTFLENQKENPCAVLGMFDPSARPCVPNKTLSFSVPMKKFVKMISYMDESFLITPTWETVRQRI